MNINTAHGLLKGCAALLLLVISIVLFIALVIGAVTIWGWLAA